jgi:Tol biopolymer transport system component
MHRNVQVIDDSSFGIQPRPFSVTNFSTHSVGFSGGNDIPKSMIDLYECASRGIVAKAKNAQQQIIAECVERCSLAVL